MLAYIFCVFSGEPTPNKAGAHVKVTMHGEAITTSVLQSKVNFVRPVSKDHKNAAVETSEQGWVEEA